MRKHVLALSIATLLVSGAAYAQQTTVTTGTAGAAVTIEPEFRTKIKSYVTEKRVHPVQVRERLAVGATVPAEVELEAVPADWGPTVSKYRYVYSNDHVVLVEPSSRKVVQIVE